MPTGLVDIKSVSTGWVLVTGPVDKAIIGPVDIEHALGQLALG